MLPTLQYRHKLLLFAFLNVADLFLTWQLWRQGGGQLLYEAHPIARHCLAGYGWIGFVAIQCFVILFGSALFAIGSRFRPRFGEGGLSFLCFVLSSVVVYRCCLAGMPAAQAQPEPIKVPVSEEALARELHRQLQRIEQYNQSVRHWADEVIRQGCTLPEAVCHMRQTKRAQDGQWLAHLRRTYGKDYSEEACCAINVLLHCANRLVLDEDRLRARGRAAALQAEFKALYQAEVPPIFKSKISAL